GELMIQYEAERCTRRQAEGWFERVRTGLDGLKGQVMIAGRGLQQRRWVDGETALTEQVGGLRLRCGDRSFVQANWRLNETLVEYKLEFMDPPPTGHSKDALAGLLRLRASGLVCLSCGRPTVASYLRAMREAG